MAKQPQRIVWPIKCEVLLLVTSLCPPNIPVDLCIRCILAWDNGQFNNRMLFISQGPAVEHVLIAIRFNIGFSRRVLCILLEFTLQRVPL